MDKIYDSTDLNPIFPHLNNKIIINGNIARRCYGSNEYIVDWQVPEHSWVTSIKDNISENVDNTELNKYKELLGHTSQDIEAL